MQKTKLDGAKLDGARLAIISNRFQGIARKMSNTLLRTGRSGVLNRARDFSCCIVTKDCELLVAADSLPIHVLSGPDLMAKAMHDFHPDLKRGDAFLNNSPYHGCSHPADHTILVPIIDDQNQHHFTVLAKAHQADIGNSIPTTYHSTAKDVYEEGALIFPSVQIQKDYQTNEDIVRMCQMRIRVAEQWHGDFLAMMGAARIGEKEVLALANELGWDTLHDFAGQWLDYSEQRMQSAIEVMPAGCCEGSSTHDPMPGTPEEGVTIKASVKVDPVGGFIDVDLTDNLAALPNGLNVSEACTRTSAMIGIFNCIDPTVPKNAGAFRRIRLKLKEGGVVGIPRHPTSCSAATTNVADRIANAVQTALSQLPGNIGLAEIGGVFTPCVGVISGIDPRDNQAYVNQLFLGFTAGGASSVNDCWLSILHVGNGGMCYQDSIELDEIYQPIEVKSRYLMKDTEGAGKFRGAPSLYVEYGPLECEIDVGYVSDGVINKPKGVRGGMEGGGAEQYLRRKDGSLDELERWGLVKVREGESIVSVTCGGGGFGDPQDRDPDMVMKDVAEGIISPDRASRIYGVAIED